MSLTSPAATQPQLPTGGLPDPATAMLWWMLIREVPEDLAFRVPPGCVVSLVSAATAQAGEDLLSLCDRDPAAGDPVSVLRSYLSFRAVAAHRLANQIWVWASTPDGFFEARSIARGIAESVKARTGVEIHPAAQIGRRFVIDHGVGTVIGETVSIGDDCYLLQGVVLGATGIAHNPTGKRHPTLGSRVEVGAFARVLGAVTIGDDCFVDPHTVTTTDVPPGHRVRLVTQTQLTSVDAAEIISGLRLCPGRLSVWGDHLEQCVPMLVDGQGEMTPLDLELRSSERLVARLSQGHERLRPDLALVAAGRVRALVRLTNHWRTQRSILCDGCGPREESL